MENEKIYPRLSPVAKMEAEDYLRDFSNKMLKEMSETLSKVYVSPIMYIESDAWINFRNELLSAIKGYPNAKLADKHDWKEIRHKIFEEHKEEIINDYILDLQEKIESLKKQLEEEIITDYTLDLQEKVEHLKKQLEHKREYIKSLEDIISDLQEEIESLKKQVGLKTGLKTSLKSNPI